MDWFLYDSDLRYERVEEKLRLDLSIRVATLSGVLEIASNFRNFAKQSGKCQENWWIFSNIRNMSAIFSNVLSGDYHIPCFSDQCKKRVQCKGKASNILQTLIIRIGHYRIAVAYYIYIFPLYIINFVHCLFSTRVWKVCGTYYFVVRYAMQKSGVNNNQIDFSFNV